MTNTKTNVNAIYTPEKFLGRVICDQEEKEKKILIANLIDEINFALSTVTYVVKDTTNNSDGTMTIRYEINFNLEYNVYNTEIISKAMDEFRSKGWRCSQYGNSYCFQIHVIKKDDDFPPVNRYSILDV